MVAEGVETDEVRSAVRDAGCDIAHGYLFGVPMSLEQLRTTLDGCSPVLMPSLRPVPVRA